MAGCSGNFVRVVVVIWTSVSVGFANVTSNRDNWTGGEGIPDNVNKTVDEQTVISGDVSSGDGSTGGLQTIGQRTVYVGDVKVDVGHDNSSDGGPADPLNHCVCENATRNISMVVASLGERFSVFENESGWAISQWNHTIINVTEEMEEMRRKLSIIQDENKYLGSQVKVVADSYDHVKDIERRMSVMEAMVKSLEKNVSSLSTRVTDVGENLDTVNKNMKVTELLEKLVKLEERKTDSVQNNYISELLSLKTAQDTFFRKYKRKFKKKLKELQIELRDDFKAYVDNMTEYNVSADEEVNNVTEINTSATVDPSTETSVMNKILVFQRMANSSQHPMVINLHRNDLKYYRYLNVSNVVTSAYIPTLGRIVLSRHSPGGLFYAMKTKSNVKTIRLNILVLGIGVDTENDLMFLSTSRPTNTISRMTLRGKHFRGIINTPGPSSPYGVAVDVRSKTVYFCQVDSLSSMDYDGKHLETIVKEGSGIYTVALDPLSQMIFYGNSNMVLQRSLASGNVTELVKIDGELWKILVYKNSLYTTSYNGSDINVVYLDNDVMFPLQVVPGGECDIVLIP